MIYDRERELRKMKRIERLMWASLIGAALFALFGPEIMWWLRS